MGDSARDLNTVRKRDSRESGTWIFLYSATKGFMEACEVQPIIRQVTKKVMVIWQITNLNTISITFALKILIDFLHIDFQIFSSQICYSFLVNLVQEVPAGLLGDPPVEEGHLEPPPAPTEHPPEPPPGPQAALDTLQHHLGRLFMIHKRVLDMVDILGH